MHRIRPDMEPNHTTFRNAAPYGAVDWRQHYPRRAWCYDSLLKALSEDFERARTGSGAGAPSSLSDSYLDAV